MHFLPAPFRFRALRFATALGTGLVAGLLSGLVFTARAEAGSPATRPARTAGSETPAPQAAAPQAAAPQAPGPQSDPQASGPQAPGPHPATAWSSQAISEGRARCAVILKRINAVAIEEAPIKEGICGAPAPIQLVSIGKNPQVSISPPAILTCDMAEALSTWVEGDLQPLARARLGAEIITIETMSSYACRNAYGRAHGKLSEHGLANALDIRGFVTASAKTAYVLEDWGTPQREILARIAAAKAAEEKVAALKAAAERAAQVNQLAAKNKAGPAPQAPPSATASAAGEPASGIARTTIVDGLPRLTVTLPGAKPQDKDATGFAIGEPNKLGGPQLTPAPLAQLVALKTTPVAVTPESKASFLHEAHNSACQIFGTTLGPEANAEHRNHLHVDMALRQTIKICE